MILPAPLAAVLLPLAPAFTAPTFERFALLAVAALLTSGRRTVANLLRTLGPLAKGHPTSYQRVLSGARWSGLALAGCLCRLVLALLPQDEPVVLVGDDTVDGHPGKSVWGKARHRDPVRSSHSYTAWRYGHKWVVLAILVRFPFASRPWALPVLVGLYRSPDDNQRDGRPHHTPAQILCRLVAVVLRWFPDRRFVLVGDAGYGTHQVARFCVARRDRLSLISKLHPDANLFGPPPPYKARRVAFRSGEDVRHDAGRTTIGQSLVAAVVVVHQFRVIAARLRVEFALADGEPADRAAPVNERGIEPPPLLEVLYERRGRPVSSPTDRRKTVLDGAVIVPRLAAQEDLHEAHAPFDQPPRDQASGAGSGRTSPGPSPARG